MSYESVSVDSDGVYTFTFSYTSLHFSFRSKSVGSIGIIGIEDHFPLHFCSFRGSIAQGILRMRWNPWNLWDSGIRRNAMSGRRRFGSVVSRTSRDGKRRYVEARYQPPVWAYAKWPDLPKHYSRRFDADYTAMAAAWLADVERHIRCVLSNFCGPFRRFF